MQSKRCKGQVAEPNANELVFSIASLVKGSSNLVQIFSGTSHIIYACF